MSPVRTVIADDEEHARRRIRTLLEQRDDLEVVAECGTGRATVEAVREHSPDLLFLDVQMPRGGGLGVVRALGRELPAVIFVTAYQQYAIDAFEAHAVDYLLKPFDDDRFDDAVDHALHRLDEAEAQRLRERLRDLLRGADPALRPSGDADPPLRSSQRSEPPGGPDRSPDAVRRFAVRKRDRIVFVDVDDIDWIGASGDYVTLHTGREGHLLRTTMRELEEQLDDSFVRIHRSYIVRIDRIRQLSHFSHGDYTVVLQDGTELRMSRTYRDEAASLLGLDL